MQVQGNNLTRVTPLSLPRGLPSKLLCWFSFSSRLYHIRRHPWTVLTDGLNELQGQGSAPLGVREHKGISHHYTGREAVRLAVWYFSKSRGPVGSLLLSHLRVRRIQNGRNLHSTIGGFSFLVCCLFVWQKSYLRGISVVEGGRADQTK